MRLGHGLTHIAGLLLVMLLVAPSAGAAPPPVIDTGSPIYFAEGSTLPGFETYLMLYNEIGGEDATVAILFSVEGLGTRFRLDRRLPAGERATIRVGDVPELRGRRAFAMTVDPDRPIHAERAVYFDGQVAGLPVRGAHGSRGIEPRTSTWFAEGSTQPGFREYLVLLNPNAVAAEVDVRYTVTSARSAGRPVSQHVTLGAGERATLDVAGAIGEAAEHTINVTSDERVAVERVMYFNTRVGDTRALGGHVAGGATPKSTWHLPEGTLLPGFATFIVIANPDPLNAARVSLRYDLEGGGCQDRSVTVHAGGRRTIAAFDSGDEGGLGRTMSGHPSGGIAATIHTDAAAGVVVDEAIYVDRELPGFAGPVTDGMAGAGSDLHNRMVFAEGSILEGFEAFLAVANPGPAQTLSVTYDVAGRDPVTGTIPLAPKSRTTVRVREQVGDGAPTSRDGAVAIVLSGQQPFAAARSLYIDRTIGGLTTAAGATMTIGRDPTSQVRLPFTPC